MTIKWTILTCSPACSNRTHLQYPVDTSQRHLFIHPETLNFGLYHIELTVTMTDYPTLSSSSSTTVSIVPTRIRTKLTLYDTLTLTHSQEQNLVLDPGTYSFDLASITFNSSVRRPFLTDELLTDYSLITFRIGTICTIVESMELIFKDSNLSKIPKTTAFRTYRVEIILSISDFMLFVFTDPWQFDGPSQSSATVFAGTLQSSRTYQFMVRMIQRRDSSLQSFGYLTVQVESTQSSTIVIG